MDWTIKDVERPVDELITRLNGEFGKGASVTGFSFLQDGAQMLALTRKIEEEVLLSGPARLHVGFQRSGKLDWEQPRYLELQSAGITTHGFGTGVPAIAGGAVATWTELHEDHRALENQWFLVALRPSPVAFVGWELSAADLWGAGGIRSAGKEFAGFVTDNEEVIVSIIEHLDSCRRRPPAAAAMSLPSVAGLLESINARHVFVLGDDGRRPHLERTIHEVLRTNELERITVFDLSAASYVTNPYPTGSSFWHRPWDAAGCRDVLGRGYLADLLNELPVAEKVAVLPSEVGFAHLADWATIERADAIVIPVEFARPSLLERLRGETLGALSGRANIALVVDDPVSGPFVLGRAATTPRRREPVGAV